MIQQHIGTQKDIHAYGTVYTYIPRQASLSRCIGVRPSDRRRPSPAGPRSGASSRWSPRPGKNPVARRPPAGHRNQPGLRTSWSGERRGGGSGGGGESITHNTTKITNSASEACLCSTQPSKAETRQKGWLECTVLRRSTLAVYCTLLLLFLLLLLTGGLASTSPPGWAQRQGPPAPLRPEAPRLFRADGDTGLGPEWRRRCGDENQREKGKSTVRVKAPPQHGCVRQLFELLNALALASTEI